MPEAVIVATGRTPIGRAVKGSLVACRPDDLSALVIKTVLEKVPQLRPSDVEDVLLGCGQPAGEAGYNIARVAAILAGLENVPGVTVNRYCSSSLQTIRMAAHAIRAGEGDVFVVAGVETVSRYMHGASDTGPHNTAFAAAEQRTQARTPAVTDPWVPLAGSLPDVYIAMGQTAENVAEFENVTRGEMDEFAVLSQTRAVANQENGFFEREIIPVTLPDGTVITKDDGPRAGTTLEGLSNLKPVFSRRRHRHRRECLPAQRRRSCGDRDERCQSQGIGHHAPGPHRGQRRHGIESRDHGTGTGRRLPSGPQARQHDDRRHRPGRDQ